MNIWWESLPAENIWVEITDRNDVGKNIIAPLHAQKGKQTPGYELLKYVKEGDIVLHWWRRPKKPENRGFYGFSTVIGEVQKGNLPWNSRGRYAKPENQNTKQARYWNLADFTEFQKPILIEELNQKKFEILKLASNTENLHGKPIYFPFCERNGKLAVNQTYFAKLPTEFLKILNNTNLSDTIFGITSELNPPKNVPRNKEKLTSGLSRQSDPEKRVTIEKYAVNKIIEYLENEGYSVEVFGKPFDLLAVKNQEILKVEVKGKQEYATKVEVTFNEVMISKNINKDYRTLLAVVDGIALEKESDKWVANGGRTRLWWDLEFSEDCLYPTRYLFTLPEE